MKNFFSMLVMTAIVCGFVACSNSKAPVPQQEEQKQTEPVMGAALIGTPAPDSLLVDDGMETVVCDSSESGGFGRCLESGCYCKEFKGRGQTCQNCGHSYKRHY